MPSSQLPIQDFARELLTTGDLDPLYIMLWRAKWTRTRLCRWLVAYWCYYHAGLCCWIIDQYNYWPTMLKVAYGGKDYPRGTERRHFRGDLAVNSITHLRAQFEHASTLVDWLIEGGPTATGVMERAKRLYGFGEWIKWKIPDMIDRLNLSRIRFVEENLNDMFSSSVAGAEEFARQMGLEQHPRETKLVYAHRALLKDLRGLKAPPLYDRPLNVQETETVFCKWKSHLGGHYPPGKDTHELRLGLLRYAACKSSQALLKTMRAGLSGGVGGD